MKAAKEQKTKWRSRRTIPHWIP